MTPYPPWWFFWPYAYRPLRRSSVVRPFLSDETFFCRHVDLPGLRRVQPKTKQPSILHDVL